MTKKWRGRPQTFNYEDRRNLAELIRRHGARSTKAIAETPISIPTLLKIAREFDVELTKGRRPRKAA